MKKALIAVTLIASSFAPVFAEDAVVHGDREFYCFYMSQMFWNNAADGAVGFARQTFNTFGDECEMIYEMPAQQCIYAAACVDGIYYACPYIYSSSLSAPTSLPVMTLNLHTGVVENLPTTLDFKPQDMCYDRANDRLLVCSGGGISEMDRTTGALTPVLSFRGDVGGVLAIDGVGRAFTINHEGWLCQINMKTGYVTKLFYTGLEGYAGMQTMEFDLTQGNDVLYWAAHTFSRDNGRSCFLQEIRLPKISNTASYSPMQQGYSIREVGEMGIRAHAMGLYIPYAAGGFDSPAAVSDMKVTNNADGTAANISFTLPEKTFGGDNLSSINGMEVFRDGTRIAYDNNVKPGQKIAFTDNDIDPKKIYRYEALTFNAAGDGPKQTTYAYIGPDRPAAVPDADIEIGADFLSAKLSWEAPSTGYHQGAFDPSQTKYDIVRLPDEYPLATDYAGTEITDNNFRRLLSYSYKITAKNENGSTDAYSISFVAGPPITAMPYTETFDDLAEVRNSWTSVDRNKDSYTWEFGSSFGHSVFGDYEVTADYYLSPYMMSETTLPADDWLISPPFKFESGKQYTVTLQARCYIHDEIFNIYTGSSSDPESMTKLGTYTLKPGGIDPLTGSAAFSDLTIDLPDSNGKPMCIGIQLSSPIPDDYSEFVQINNVIVAEKDTQGISDVTVDAAGDAEYFNLQGVRIDNPANGVYLRRSAGKVEKVYVK